MSPRRLAVLASLLLAIGAAGCGGDDDDAGPRAEDVPSGAVAKVGDREISEQELDRQVAAIARSVRGGSAAPGSDAEDGDDSARQERERLESQALAQLLQRQAIEQEAADRGIEVTQAEVRERWRASTRGQFKTRKALRRFLGGQTEQDLLSQLRLQFLTERIHEQIREQAGGGRKGAEAVERFQREFPRRWAERTACRDGVAAAGCSDERAD